MTPISRLPVTALALAGGLLVSACALAAPTVTWVSDPVRPDETAMLLGQGCSPDCIVEAARLADAPAGSPGEKPVPEVPAWTALPPLQVAPQSAKAVIPAAWKPGVYALRVRCGAQTSNTLLANAPDPWWLQADEGLAGTPGGWVRAFGKCLGFGGEGQVVLRDARGAATALGVTRASCWALTAALPPTLAPGDYAVFIHNGLGGEATWRQAGKLSIIAPVAWKTDLFTVPVEGEPGDTDKAIRETLEQAQANGGGVVLLRRGTYDVKGQLTIPPGTVLRGEGMGLVNLYWRNDADPPRPLIRGTRCALQDLSVYCFNYQTVVADTPDSDRFRLERVRIRAIPDAVRSSVIKPKHEPTAAVHILGRNFQVTGCDIYAAAPGNGPSRAIVTGPWGFSGDKGPWYGIIADNDLHGHLYGCENIKGLIFERNTVEGVSVGASTYWNNFAQNLYFADNRVRHVYGGDREIMTFDAGGGAYLGKAATVQGTHLTLVADPEFHDYAPRAHTDYKGATVLVLDGAGAGQYRFVTANQGREWEVDRPWDIVPDATSVLSIVPFRGRNLFIGNTFLDGGAMQLYGSAIDIIVAENRGARIDGFFTWGLNPHGWGWQPAWCCQFLDNELTEGSGYGGRVWGPAFFGVTTSNSDATYPGPLARGNIFRRNVLQSQAYFRIEGVTEDTLVERCTVRHSRTGIRVGKTARHTVLRENVFEDVTKPLEGEGIAEAWTTPVK